MLSVKYVENTQGNWNHYRGTGRHPAVSLWGSVPLGLSYADIYCHSVLDGASLKCTHMGPGNQAYATYISRLLKYRIMFSLMNLSLKGDFLLTIISARNRAKGLQILFYKRFYLEFSTELALTGNFFYLQILNHLHYICVNEEHTYMALNKLIWILFDL